ncbi:unnamed protein product [Polarella glacialis]|uniref:Uncharacterized protein n=1 Tax=Polarella glacialis TaxID=89957 RepID=A0A813H4F0_POLGL|nr:unnamed protein product [Polarella glacialis]
MPTEDSAAGYSFAIVVLTSWIWVKRNYLLHTFWSQSFCWKSFAEKLLWGTDGDASGRARQQQPRQQKQQQQHQQQQQQQEAGQQAERRRVALERTRLSTAEQVLSGVSCLVVALLACRLALAWMGVLPGRVSLFFLPLGALVIIALDMGMVPLTSANLDRVVCLSFLVLSVYVLLVPACEMMGNAIVLWRVLLGLGFVNPKKAMLCNIMACLAIVYRASLTVQENTTLSPTVLGTEIVCLFHITTLTVLFQVCIESGVDARLEVVCAERSQLSSKKLLSVLCDAVVSLGPDLRIIGSTLKLCHLLMTGFGKQSKGMNNVLFTDLLAEGDQKRFRDFVYGWNSLPNADRHMSDTSESCPSGRSAPGSLRVRLRDAGGLWVLVDIVHVTVPDLDDLSGSPGGHLLGIRDESSVGELCGTGLAPNNTNNNDNFNNIPLSPEISEDQGLRGQMSAPANQEPQDCFAPDSRRAISEVHAGNSTPADRQGYQHQRLTRAALEAVSAPAGVVQTQTLADMRNRSSRSHASSAGSSSRAVRFSMPQIESVTATVDALSSSCAIHVVTIRFNSRAYQPACMGDYMPSQSLVRLRTWIQKNINDSMAGTEPTDPVLKSMELRLPGIASGTLFVGESTLSCADGSDESEEEKEDKYNNNNKNNKDTDPKRAISDESKEHQIHAAEQDVIEEHKHEVEETCMVQIRMNDFSCESEVGTSHRQPDRSNVASRHHRHHPHVSDLASIFEQRR